MALLGQDFDSLKKIISGNKVSALTRLGIAQTYHEIVDLIVEPAFEITSYAKGEHKEYALTDHVNFKGKYRIIYDIQLIAFGFENESSGTLELEIGNYRIAYSIDHLNLRSLSAYLRGRLEGDEIAMGGEFVKAKSKFIVKGIKTVDSLNLHLYQEVIAEGYLLELENNLNMAFFTYFSAIDNYIDQFFEEYRATLYTELSKSIRRLSIKAKLAIVFKHKCAVTDLNTLTIWSIVSSMFNDVVGLRNLIAHGRQSQPITKEDLDLCFFCALIIILSISHSCRTYRDFKDILIEK